MYYLNHEHYNKEIRQLKIIYKVYRMSGGLLNLYSYGTSNILIYGNPQKSVFFKTYKSITNFGMQRFRLDTTMNNNNIGITEESIFEFEIERYAEMVGDCYFVVTLPDVYSPLFKNEIIFYAPEFRWIREIGVHMIKEVEILSGGQTLSKYTGEYFSILAHKDRKQQIDLWRRMIGDTPQLNNPAQVNNNKYPNAIFNRGEAIEPSIRGRKLYVPLDVWFCRSPNDALPLVATQYAPITIRIRLRPLRELYIVANIDNNSNLTEPNYSIYEHQPHRFFQQPKAEPILPTSQTDDMHPSQILQWKPDIHIIANYYFLSDEERTIMANRVYKHLIKDVYTHTIKEITGPSIHRIYSSGLVASYLFRLRRSDAKERNDWNNYTNTITYKEYDNKHSLQKYNNTTHYKSGPLSIDKKQDILETFQIVLDGMERENELDSGIIQYIEPYARTHGNGKVGLYQYHFTCQSDSLDYQPYGGMNMDKFGEIMFHLKTMIPPPKDNIESFDICDDDGVIIGSRKRDVNLYKYSYDLEIFEERYNTIVIRSGNIGLLFAR